MYIIVDDFLLQFECKATPLSFDDFLTSYQKKESERQSHFRSRRKIPVAKRCPDPECVRVSHANVRLCCLLTWSMIFHSMMAAIVFLSDGVRQSVQVSTMFRGYGPQFGLS